MTTRIAHEEIDPWVSFRTGNGVMRVLELRYASISESVRPELARAALEEVAKSWDTAERHEFVLNELRRSAFYHRVTLSTVIQKVLADPYGEWMAND